MNTLKDLPVYDFLFKIVAVGDSGVGKSALTCRYTDNTFDESFISTLGIDFRIKTVVRAGKEIKLQIWDTAGQERFRALTRSYYRGCSGIFLVFDTTSFSSFQHLKFWLDDVQKFAPADTVKIVIGTKSDMLDRREVTRKAAEDFCQIHGLQYVETSAKQAVGVDQAFNDMISQLLGKFNHGNFVSTKPTVCSLPPTPKTTETTRLNCLC